MKINDAIEKDGAEGYFAAANTRYGFYSMYDEVYSEVDLDRVFIIKGGPGTGKSTMMHHIAELASNEKLHTDVYLCSSAPESIDGVIIKELGVAVLDGTAPHTKDPIYPGVVGENVDLGRFWDETVLVSRKSELISLIQAKSDAYKRAYRFLSAAGEAYDDVLKGVKNAFLEEKAKKSIKRLLDKHKLTAKNICADNERKFLGAISTSGTVSLDTFERKAEVLYAVSELYGAEKHWFELLRGEGEKRGLKMTVVPDPLSPEYVNGIYFEEVGLYVSSEISKKASTDVINMKRFIDKTALSAVRTKERMSAKIKAMLLSEALVSLEEAGRFHAETERIYGTAMDFDKVKSVTDELAARIFK